MKPRVSFFFVLIESLGIDLLDSLHVLDTFKLQTLEDSEHPLDRK